MVAKACKFCGNTTDLFTCDDCGVRVCRECSIKYPQEQRICPDCFETIKKTGKYENVCQSCGIEVLKSEMKRCSSCGRLVCPKCISKKICIQCQ